MGCVEATLDEWWGGGSKEMTASSREHATRALWFVRSKLSEIRAERDELRERVYALERMVRQNKRDREFLLRKAEQLEQEQKDLRRRAATVRGAPEELQELREMALEVRNLWGQVSAAEWADRAYFTLQFIADPADGEETS